MRRRERWMVQGAFGLGDAELLALLVETGSGGRTALEIAAELLDRFGDLRGVARAEIAELVGVAGVGTARAVRVQAALELGRRAVGWDGRPTPVTTPELAFAALGPGLKALADEELHALYLDRRRRPVAVRRLTRGSDAFTVVDARQVFRAAVGLGASAVILAHNHPSGDPTPSTQDHDVTQRVAQAGRMLGVPLLDHLVVGGEGYASLAAAGALPEWAPSPSFTAEPG